jgi:integrase
MHITAGRPLDAAGRPRSPAAMPGYLAGRPPRNKGLRYPADPPRVEEIVAVMREAGPGVHGARVRGLIVVLWRAGLRISEALSPAERDLDPGRGAILVRHGKGGRRREVGMDEWGWEQLRPWFEHRGRCRSGRCSASLTDRRAGDRGRARLHESSSGASPSKLVSGAALLPISSATHMLSRWPAKGCR